MGGETPRGRLVPPAEGRATSKQRAELPAAEDPRIFFLHHTLPPANWERPRRTYPVRRPDSPHETEIRPEYHSVNAPAADTDGLALMFPPHTVHARNSTAAVVRTACELTQVDHVHIRRAVVARNDALRSAEVEEIVARARPGRDNTPVVHQLRRVLAERGPAPTNAACVSTLHRATTVRLGADALTRLDSRYVVELTIIPAGALLAGHEDLARRYVEIVADEPDDPAAVAGFLSDLVGAAENATDDNVLGYADGLADEEATVLGLFGMAAVDPDSSIAIDDDGHPTDLDPDRDDSG